MLHKTDFELTRAELARVNDYIGEMAARHAGEGEDCVPEVSVTFTFVPGLGRVVAARFAGAVEERVIDLG